MTIPANPKKKTLRNSAFTFKTAFLILSVFMLGGCVGGTTEIAYTSSAPPEKLCTLIIATSLTVKNFDGEDVQWKKAASGDFWVRVQIPEGSHTFIMDSTVATGGGHFEGSDISFSYDGFAAGHVYRMWPQIAGVSGKNAQVTIMVRDIGHE